MEPDFLTSLLADTIAAGTEADSLEAPMPTARQHRLAAKRRCRRMLQEETLSEAIPDPPAPGESIHAISNGKYDFATWIPQIIAWWGKADSLWCSTWTLSRANALDIFAVHDAGQIDHGQLHFLTGLYFKRRESATYTLLLDGLLQRGGRYKALETHSKVLLLANAAANAWITVEGSANLNGNPRLEQYVLTNDRGLWEFHREWMEWVFATPTKQYRSTTTHRESRMGYSARRAGLGVMAARNDAHSRNWLQRVKAAPILDEEAIAKAAADVAAMIHHWLPTLPAGLTVTHPPQGATWPNEHFATHLARAVAGLLHVPAADLLIRTDEKHYHGAHASLAQTPYTLTRDPAGPVLIVDDMITSGNTMQLALAAVQTTGQPAWGFAYVAY